MLALTVALAGCATLPEAPPRAAASPLGCVRTTVATRVPRDVGDKLQHCLAAGLIARHCSVTEARLASWGKEIGDALGPGDADGGDLEADHAGIRCARGARDDAGLRRCCEALHPAAAGSPAAPAAPAMSSDGNGPVTNP